MQIYNSGATTILVAFPGERDFYYSQSPRSPLPEGRESSFPHGTIIAIGGNADSSSLGHVSRATGGRRLLVLTLASDLPNESFESTQQAFGLPEGRLAHVPTREELMSQLREDPIYISGGDQEALVDRLRNSGKDVLRQFSRTGNTVIGTSAGAAAMGQIMIVGDREATGEAWHIKDGLGLIPGVVIDTHFSTRNRWDRLQDTVRRRGMLGIGLDENTGFISTEGSTTFDVIGVGGVHILNGGAEVHLIEGDRYDLLSKKPVARKFAA